MFKYLNNYQATLTASITASATSMTVSLPITLGVDEVCRLTIQNDDASLFEIIDVTAASDATLTIERGKDDTTAQAWESGSIVVCSITASQANDYDVKNEKWFTATSSAINISNGSKQKLTLAANAALSFTLNDGDDLTLILNPATFTATFPTITWFGSTPTLTASKQHTIVISKNSGSFYGWWQVAV